MFRIKKFALAAVALSALSLSVTGCFGDDSSTNPVTAADSSAKLYSYSKNEDGSAIIAGAQNATPGSFISVQGATIYTKGTKTAEDEATIDLVFSASTNTTTGTPTFYSPATAPNDLSGWAVKNPTIIVKSAKASSAIATVNAAKAEIGTATSQSAEAVAGGVYVVKTANGQYGLLEVLSMTAAGNASTVTLKLFSQN